VSKVRGKVGNSARYRRSARYFRRRRQAVVQAVWVAPIFGSLTAVIAALAKGPVRRVNMFGLFPERIFTALPRTDVAGLTASWYLPSLRKANGNVRLGKGGARRGCALALNPAFPLSREVRALADSIAKAYGIVVESDLTAEEAKLIRPNDRIDIYRLCGSPVRTKALFALHCLRRPVGTTVLYRSVPGESANSVKKVITTLKQLGIVAIEDGIVEFAETPWRKEFRALLRAFARHDPAFRDGVRALAKERTARAERQYRYGLFGKDATERVLRALALHGSMSRDELEARAQIFGDHRILGRLKKMGLLIHRTVKHRTMIALNASHPVFETLRAYLLESGAIAPENAATVALREPSASFSVKTLFATQLRLEVLVMVHLSDHEGIDGADLKRLLPQHTARDMVDKLWDFCALGLVVENPMDFGMIRYRLDPKFKHYRALTSLLDAIVKMHPQYRRVYAHREDIWPAYRATRERNRKAQMPLSDASHPQEHPLELPSKIHQRR
jgi:hypothetical protein